MTVANSSLPPREPVSAEEPPPPRPTGAPGAISSPYRFNPAKAFPRTSLPLPENLYRVGDVRALDALSDIDRLYVDDIGRTRGVIEAHLAEFASRWDGEAAKSLARMIARWWRP